MAPSAYSSDLRLRSGLSRRDRSDACSGWNCLGDAAQFGIILVIVAFVLVTGYLYWRLKIKPNFLGSRGDTRSSVNGYWEVTRRDPSRVSITIYREPRPPSDSEAGQDERCPAMPRKGDNGPTQQEDIVTNQVAKQLGAASTSDVHLVPPPPPPPAVFWAAPAPSVIPPPPPFGPPSFLQPGPPPTPLHPNPLGFGIAAVPYPPVAPPPYFGHARPQNPQGQYPMPGVAATSQPACAPPPATPSAPPRNENRGRIQTPPVTEPQSQWRRWFSVGARPPIVGHARTLSDVSSTVSRSRSPSPPPPSISPPKRDRGRGRDYSRHPFGRQLHPLARDRQPRQHSHPSRQPAHSSARNQRRHRNNSPPQSESSLSSSYLNTSLEAVLDTREPPPQSFRNHVRASSDPESRRRHRRHGQRPARDRDTRIRPSDTVPLANLLHHRRRRPSPDVQFPSPEPHQPRVSFELPGGSDDGSISSSSSSPSRSSESQQRRVGGRSRQSRREDDHGSGSGRRRHEGVGRGREQRGLAGRITGTFYRMRRALRGED